MLVLDVRWYFSTLSRACVEKENQENCHHQSKDRRFTVQYDRNTKTGGLFSEYINNFFKIKQERSGWPNWCNTAIEKE